MTRHIRCLFSCVLLWAVLAGSLPAAEPKEVPKPDKPAASAAKPAEAPKPSAPDAAVSHRVKREPLKIEVTVKGILEAEKTAEIALRPEVWAMFEVVKAAEHGQAVKRGDVLVQFDAQKIDDEIADQRTKRAISDLTFKQAEETLRALAATTPMDLEAADRTRKYAHEDLARFLKIDLALSKKSADVLLKSAQDYLENQRDELNQLEKMYKADDLAEETEKIVLKRQRRAVERAEFMVEMSRAGRDETLKIELPRRQITMEQGVKKLDVATAKAKVTLPALLSVAQKEMEKLKIDRVREEQKFKKLLADRELMTLKAPIDGVVYYGRFARGKWPGMEMIAESLRPGGMVMKSAVVMTVVQPRPMFLRASLGEADLQKVRPGMKGTAQPAALPELKLPATVSRVDKIPSAADSFEVRVQVQTDAKAEALVPGMTCSVKIVSFSEKNVLTIPAKALMLDEADETKTYVFVVRQGKPEKRDVTVGKRADDRVQIVRGLAEGDEVLLEKPKETKPDQPKAAAEKAAEKKKDEKQASQPKAAEKEKAAADAGKEKKPAEEKKEPAKKKSSKPKGKGKKKSPESSSATK